MYCLQSAPILPYHSLKGDHSLASLIESHPHAITSSETGDTRIPYAVVRGHAGPMRPGTELSSDYATLKDVKGVVKTFELTEHQKHFSRSGFWHTTKRGIHTFANDVPFGLLPSYTTHSEFQRPPLEMSDWRDASRLQLDTTFDQFRESPTSIGAHLLGWLMGDIQKGVQYTEQMLLNGTALTAVGEVVFEKNDRQGRVQAPTDGRSLILTKSNFKSLVKEIEGEAKLLKYILWVRIKAF